MNDQNNAFLDILDVRDASIVNLQKSLATLEDELRRKEVELLKMTREAEEKDASIEEKEASIEEKEDALLKMTREAEEKEAALQKQRIIIEKYASRHRRWRYIIVPTERLVKALNFPFVKVRAVFAPRIGKLDQYVPKDLSFPDHYYQLICIDPAPKISIVTPSFKQADFIERTLNSVFDQKYPNLEYYVQDGGSEDGTKEILEKYSDRLTGWESTPDKGQTNAINLGFAKTTGEIMAWLNSDDIILPGTLAYVADYFNRHPEVDVVYGNRLQIDINDQHIGRWIMPEHEDEVLSWADFIPQETLYWRRSIWEKAGGEVDESFRFAMDWDFLVRLRDSGARFARLPRFMGGFRIHPDQKTSAQMSDIGAKEMNRIRERLLGRTPSEKEIFKAVKPYLLRHIVTDLAWRIRKLFGYSKF